MFRLAPVAPHGMLHHVSCLKSDDLLVAYRAGFSWLARFAVAAVVRSGAAGGRD